MASDNRNQDKVKIREGEWNNYSCFLFLISIAQNPSLSGALWLILVFSVCIGQFVERDQGSFYYPRELVSHGSVPWGLKPGYRVTEPCQVSLDRKPLSAGPGDSFLWVIKCDVSRVFLFCDFFSYWWHNMQTDKTWSANVFYRYLLICRVFKFVKKSLDGDLWIIARVSSCLLSLEPGNVLWINRWMYPVLSCLTVHNHTG